MKLHEEEEFYDYKTAPVVGDNVIDLHKTGMSYYDDFLSNDSNTINYLKNKKNLKGDIVMMSPKEYFEECAEYGFPGGRRSYYELISQRRRDINTLTHLENVLKIYKKRFPMPVLNKASNAQEGLHRMMVVGDLFGWDHKVPVLVVDWADKQRASEEAERKRIEKIEYRIRRAVQDTLYYKFTNIDELKEQLQWELDKQFDSDDDVSTPVQFELTSDEEDKEFTVTIGIASYSFDYDDVQFIGPSEEDDLDDVDFEVDNDFLVKYFGDDWRETFPHLKDKFNIKESVEQLDVKQIDTYILEHFGQDHPGQGCIFIHPNGKFINIYPKLDDHEDLCYWLEENGFGKNPEDPTWFVDEFNYIRCRNSLHLCFVDLPKTITRSQTYALEEWMETKVTTDYIDIEAPNGEWHKYNLDEYFPEDLIKIIKRYYASGKLYEDIK